ncbi:MAG: MATE family efflux transporter [Prevotellaceae bacterium]|nr:MATE family efflux transporter [Candidatus Minthosoma caballi]
MEEGEKISLKKDLRKLAGPIFIETLLVMTMGAVDTFMLSQYNDHAVAAVGVVNQLVMFSFLIFQIINMGTSVLCSQYIGAGMRRKMVQVTGVALILNLLFGIAVSAMLYFGAEWLLTLMGLRPELMQYGLPYMQIVGMFAFFQALHLTISASLRADHKAIYPMLVVIVVNIVNIGGNYGLIFGHFGLPALGVEGAAIATAFSRGTAMVLLFIILFTKHIRSFPLQMFTPFPWEEVRKLLKIGMPSAGENMSYEMQQVVLTYFINQIGNDALTTRTYVVNIVMFVYLFGICMAQGGAISIGHLVGEHKPKAAYILGKFVMKWSVLVGFVLSVSIALFGDKIFPLLTDNANVIALGCTILFCDIMLEVGRTINIYATTVLRATGDVYFPFYLGVVIQWGVGVVFGYLFGLEWQWGLVGMWIAFALDENIRGAIFIWRWRSMKWAKKAFV